MNDVPPFSNHSRASRPEVLPPAGASLRGRLGAGVFSNANLDHLSHLLDDCFRLPGTKIRFGVGGLIGLVPFAGDVLAGILSSLIVVAAWTRGAPPILLARMMVNLGLDVLVGMIPIFGDAFDIAWKANRRNYLLLSRHIAEPGRHRGRDWAFLLVLLGSLLVIFALPFLVLGYLIGLLLHG
jgi:hypothetical protein